MAASHESPRLLSFDGFRMDLADERLWPEDKHVRLTPKAFAMLRYLAERSGQLVTKEQLLEAVWPDTTVSESVLTNGMRELRCALGDRARAPEFIETVHRRGYRFLVSVTTRPREADEPPVPMARAEDSSGHDAAEFTSNTLVPLERPTGEGIAGPMVSRELEREALRQHFARTLVRPAKAGVFSGSQSRQGKSQNL